MAWRFHGRARVNARAPVSFAVCDRCSRWYNITDLSWQFGYAGPNLQNLRLLVCRQCLDIPQPQLKPRILPPDPMPTLNARPENFSIDDEDWLVTDDLSIITSDGGLSLINENSSNYRGNDPLPISEPPIIDSSYLVTVDAFLITEDGSYLTTGGS